MKVDIKFKAGIFFLFVILLGGCKPEVDEPKYVFENMTGFVIDKNDQVYISTIDSLFSFDMNDWRVLTYIKDGAEINGLALDEESGLWLATSDGAVNFDRDTIVVASENGLSSSEIEFLEINADRDYYFVTATEVSVLYDNKWFVTAGASDLFEDFQVTDIGLASNDYTFVSTLGGGVGRFYTDLDGISGATVFNSDWTWLQSNNVLTVFIDDTVQWYGLEGGVAVHFSEKTKWDWEVYDVSAGLISDTIISIIKDGSGDMWFGSYRGLSRFDGDSWTSYSRASGDLTSDTVRFMAIDQAGAFCLASYSGLTKFTGQAFIHFNK